MQKPNNSVTSDEQLGLELTEYNKYLGQILNQIQDFDVWYEINYGKSFPKEWYSAIKTPTRACTD